MNRRSFQVKRESHGTEFGARRRNRRSSNLAFTVVQGSSPKSSVFASLLILYGLMVLMLGVVIPISDALAKPVEHADYRQMYYIFMHGMGIVCLVYLNSLISCYQHHRAASRAVRKRAFPATTDNGGGATEAGDPGRHREEAADAITDTGAAGHANRHLPSHDDQSLPSSADDYHSRQHGKTEIEMIDISTIYEEDGPRRVEEPLPVASSAATAAGAGGSYLRNLQNQRGSIAALRKRFISGVSKKLSSSWRTPINYTAPNAVLEQGAAKGITWAAVGINLYLRLGAIVFGFGVMVHDGFKIADVIENPGSEACIGPWFLPKHCVHLIFIMCQTYYVFKHHRVAINTQKVFVRFSFVHLIVTNLCIWMKTVIYEISMGLTHSNDGHSKSKHLGAYNITGLRKAAVGIVTNYTMSSNDTQDFCMEQFMSLESAPSYKLGPYLYPCAVEYGLICAAICFKFFSRVGDTEVVPYGKKVVPAGPRSTTCHKSHKGLFLGLIVMISILIPMISLIFLQKADKTRYRQLYIIVVILIECSVLCCTTGMAVLGTFKAMKHLQLFKVRGNEAFDVNLLFVGLAGIVCYNLFVAVSVSTCLFGSKGSSGHCKWGGVYQMYTTKANGLKSVLEVVQSVTQTLFIMQAIQRKVTSRLLELEHKPGRGLTIALLISNLAMWIASVFDSQRTSAEKFLLNYFGQMPWYIIKFFFLPLIIFFRFHSTVCLSEIWIQSYKLPKPHHHRHPKHVDSLD